MHVAVCGRGSSLPGSLPGGLLVVSINHAVPDCDWLAALDYPAAMPAVRPRAGIITADCYVPEWKERHPLVDVRGHGWCTLPPCLTKIANSSIFAMLFAVQELYAEAIDVYGVDLVDDDQRCNDERRRWSLLIDHLRCCGMEITEHGLHQTPRTHACQV